MPGGADDSASGRDADDLAGRAAVAPLAALVEDLPEPLRRQALTHSSWTERRVDSFERLAFLGDSVLGLSVADTTQAGGVNLGWREIRLPHPVFVGDTIRSETEVLSARESRSRPAQGIVEVRTRGLNQHDEVVCEFERSFLIPKGET